MVLSENSLISRIKAVENHRLPRHRFIRIGIGDDAALLRPAVGHDAILTCDWFLEGTHFLRDRHLADSTGWKCLARALSDIAAMGGRPRCFLLSLALPKTLTGQWLNAFLFGLRRAARHFECPLAGGDTSRHQQILIGITVMGDVPLGQAILRSSARPGDLLFVSGTLGQAEIGLAELRAGKLRPARFSFRHRFPLNRLSASLRKHLYPQPRLTLGRWLAKNRLATAMMDLSDGLSTDLPRLCTASRVGALIDGAKIPLSAGSANPASSHPAPVSLSTHISAAGLIRSRDPLASAMHGGDDYELLFAVSPVRLSQIPASFRGIPLTQIGKITRSRTIVVSLPGNRKRPLRSAGWDPFQ